MALSAMLNLRPSDVVGTNCFAVFGSSNSNHLCVWFIYRQHLCRHDGILLLARRYTLLNAASFRYCKGPEKFYDKYSIRDIPKVFLVS